MADVDLDENSTPQLPRLCSQSKCNKTLDAGYQFRSCEQCRERDKAAKRRKRQREKEEKEARKRPRMTSESMTANGNCPEVIVIDSDTERSDNESNREVTIDNLVIKNY
jgi:hypothetical protein